MPAGPTPSIISTGVPGLDELLRGGLTADRMYLVQGDPGTGKTTLAMQFLMEGRQHGESCLYVTLSELSLNSRGVASIIVIAQHGIIGTTMATPIDLSYVADCVVLLRFFEAQGAVRKAISVVKKRTGPHESTIRELMIGPVAVRAGAALSKFQGVLTGVPTYVGTTGPLLSE